jgi:hypothetical protein
MVTYGGWCVCLREVVARRRCSLTGVGRLLELVARKRFSVQMFDKKLIKSGR